VNRGRVQVISTSIERLIEQVKFALQKEGDGIDLWSKEYFFDKKYAPHRSMMVMHSGSRLSRSLLSLLIREGMTEERREKIFSGDYDLGNTRTLLPELCSYKKLVAELYGEGSTHIDADNDPFETIKKGICRITGRDMQDHFKVNKSTALKVIRTLNILARNREPRLMQLLILPVPPKKFSMSFRDSYPYMKNQEQVWLIADLKANLSVELSEKRFHEIALLFSSLEESMKNIIWNVEKILVGAYHSDYSSMFSVYADLVTAVESYQVQHERKALPLDEELFIHLHMLEFAHFAIGYPNLIAEQIPTLPVTPVIGELKALTKKAFPALFVAVKEDGLRIAINDIPEFSLRWQKEIIAMMEKAMGESMTFNEFDKIKPGVQILLRNFYSHQDIGNGALSGEMKISPWYVIAAFCCVWYPRLVNTPESEKIFKPYWLGQAAQGGTLHASVNDSRIGFAVDRVPEEHRHIWNVRLEWFADALRGHTELRVQRLNFRAALIRRILDICSTNDTDWIAQKLISLSDYIKDYVLCHHNDV
jgi:hypothetical protein